MHLGRRFMVAPVASGRNRPTAAAIRTKRQWHTGGSEDPPLRCNCRL